MKYEYDEESSAGTKLTYLLIGGGLGALIALLFAPKSGQELRGDIADATRKGIEKGKETATLVGERAGEYYEVSREKAGELYQVAQEKAGELKEKAGELKEKAGSLTERAKEAAAGTTNPFSAAIEAGKDAYQEEKERLGKKSPGNDTPTLPTEDKVLELPKDTDDA